MQQNSHLRQRHGSDAFRFDNSILPADDHQRRPHSRTVSASHSPSATTPPTLENDTNLHPNPAGSHLDSSRPTSSHRPHDRDSLRATATDFGDPARDEGRPATRSGRSSSLRNGPLGSAGPNHYHSGASSSYAQHANPHPSPLWELPTPVSPTSPGFPLTLPHSRERLPSVASTPSPHVTDRLGNPAVSYPSSAPTWSNMPSKDQLAILAASRFVDFFQMASLQTYMVHQLKSFDPSLPNSDISHQAGVLQGSFTAAQIITSILWGRAADQPGVGRKAVLMIGLVGTAITMLGVGFSSSYREAVMWRVLGGAINGTVGSARTMVAETVPKPWHPRAFLLLPAAFNVANVAGPILGGLLVEPLDSFPSLFGPGSLLGGDTGLSWMHTYPYALANGLSSLLLLGEALLVHFYLRETLKGFHNIDYSKFHPLVFVRGIVSSTRTFKSRGTRMISETAKLKRGLLSGRGEGSIELDRIADDLDRVMDENEKGQPRPIQRLPFRRIWTSNVLWTLLSIAIFDFHMGAFNNLWTLFLSTNRAYVAHDENLGWSKGAAPDGIGHGEGSASGYDRLLRRAVGKDRPSPPTSPSTSAASLVARSAFKFSGGLAFPPTTIGFAMAIIGFVGVTLQFLLYPWANARFGLMRCFRMSLFLFQSHFRCLSRAFAS